MMNLLHCSLTIFQVLFFVILIVKCLNSQESRVRILKPNEGNGYDLFFYDGNQFRDEKWRFNPLTGSTVVNNRYGFRDLTKFHIVDQMIDKFGRNTHRTFSINKDVDEFVRNRVQEPKTDDIQKIPQNNVKLDDSESAHAQQIPLIYVNPIKIQSAFEHLLGSVNQHLQENRRGQNDHKHEHHPSTSPPPRSHHHHHHNNNNNNQHHHHHHHNHNNRHRKPEEHSEEEHHKNENHQHHHPGTEQQHHHHQQQHEGPHSHFHQIKFHDRFGSDAEDTQTSFTPIPALASQPNHTPSTYANFTTDDGHSQSKDNINNVTLPSTSSTTQSNTEAPPTSTTSKPMSMPTLVSTTSSSSSTAAAGDDILLSVFTQTPKINNESEGPVIIDLPSENDENEESTTDEIELDNRIHPNVLKSLAG